MVNGIDMDVGGGGARSGKSSGGVISGSVGKGHCYSLSKLSSELWESLPRSVKFQLKFSMCPA